jgi:ribosomal protein S18 acetylase RimI-like enzyme
MIIYSTLENTDLEKLHKAFIEAFSDYEVKLDLSLLKFQNMLQRRGYVSKSSIGALKNDKLVGFILNGIRNWEGKLTTYDVGTAVIKNYRGHGITSNMFLNATQLLKELEVEQYLLEVIQSNESAVKLYKKQGFEILRDLECYKIDKNKYSNTTTYNVEHINIIDEGIWDKLIKNWDSKPSWQNSIDSINALSEAFIYSIVIINDIVVGYGIIDKKTGDIPQIAVDKNYRFNGIGKSILTDLINNTESRSISILNVDSNCDSLKKFLLHLGFENSVSQYEMVLKL